MYFPALTAFQYSFRGSKKSITGGYLRPSDLKPILLSPYLGHTSTVSSPVVTICTTRFNLHKFYVLPIQCIRVFCVDLRTNSDYFPVQHKLTGLYNWEGVCLLRGTDWVFIYNSTFCPHSVFMCFVWIWEQTATISLYSINWLVCRKPKRVGNVPNIVPIF